MKKSAIIKIDLCGSKDYVDEHNNYEGNIREKLLDELSQFVKGIYPYSDKTYPEGCIYSAQGDCIYIILDRPTVAVRSTIEFMKGWYSNVPALPDCRAVIDYGEINESEKIGKLELLGEPFENIAKMEKHFNAGEIGVTDKVIDKSDNTIVQYIRPIEIDITESRKINTYIANYEDPRLIQYSSLAHALFIADPPGANIRDKAFEAFLIEAILEKGETGLSLELFKNWLHNRNIPEPSPVQLERIVDNSKFIDCDDNDIFCYKPSINKKIESVQESFINSQNNAIDHIISKIAEKIGISNNELSDNLDIKSLTEEYLCAVFLQIRMMANYFRSTGSLFERLSSYKEFDYIIIKYFKRISPNRIEEYTLFKRAFLEALKDLAQKNDMYIASIFHNVLLLYYLNRNSRLSRGQLAAVKEKEIYLDTNTFYALTCRASNFHRILVFIFTRLRKLGSSVFLFDKSLLEYLESLESTLHKYRHNRHYEFVDGGPWIWKEFISDASRYKNDFEYCIALHKYPKILPTNTTDFFKTAEEELKRINVNLLNLEPYFEKEELGELYYNVYNAKLKYDPSTKWFAPKGSPDQYHNLVLHDANCLKKLKHYATNPFNAKKLFVTCDFGLAKIRRKIPNKYEYLVTVPEFYEFMLPYLFMENLMIKEPVEMPNFLLASVVHKDLFETINFKDLFGNYLANNINNIDDFKVLEDLSTEKRYKKIRDKYESLSENSTDTEDFEEKLTEFMQNSTELLLEYSNKVRESLAKSIVQTKLNGRDKELKELKNKFGELELKVKKYEEKEDKRKKYYQKKKRK